ncbi:MAG: UDP-galactose-lipid carrier transferase [Herpetosiphonaceae bacterium]|nr:UDP-galactose-lipid carrier transferase [Herpetosiphonaceae bacterium]
MLETLDLSLKLPKDKYNDQLDELQAALRTLHLRMVERHRPLIIAYEGWDAAGKGGNIKRLTERLDPRFITVYGISKPTPEELDHHYLWRFWTKLPSRDHTVIFDRSWYGRLLVERVEGFATTTEWQRAYDEINEFERLLSDDGAIIIKIWLHVSPEEQLRRFESRMADPAKRWKMNDEDWRNRGKWDEYLTAAEEMFTRTTTSYAPWTLVEGDNKRWARIKVLRAVVDRLQLILGPAPDVASAT